MRDRRAPAEADTLHIGEAAESRALADAVGPEIGVGQWRFVCLFECCDAGSRETVACIGEMSWTRDPRLPREPDPATLWEPGSGPFPDIAEQRRREQAEPHRHDVQAAVRVAVKNVLRKRGVKAVDLEGFVSAVMEQAEASFRDCPIAA